MTIEQIAAQLRDHVTIREREAIGVPDATEISVTLRVGWTGVITHREIKHKERFTADLILRLAHKLKEMTYPAAEELEDRKRLLEARAREELGVLASSRSAEEYLLRVAHRQVPVK